MTKTEPSSRIILEVERAASDLRRGQGVVLTGAGKDVLLVVSAEYRPGGPEVKDAKHPAVQLMKLAGLLPQAVVKKASAKDKKDLLSVTAAAVKQYPAALAESLVEVSQAEVPLKGAKNATVIAFRPRFGHEEHLAVVIGKPRTKAAPLVRIHSSCVTGDVFGSLRCDCGSQLHQALKMIEQQGAGAVLYLSQEGRGIGIANKLRAYGLQDQGMDTVEANEALGFAADERDFALAAAMLKHLGLTCVTLLTNNPVKVAALTRHGIKVAKCEKLITKANWHNKQYLATKAEKLGHQF